MIRVKRKHGERGKHKAPRRLLSATAEQWAKMDRAASRARMKWGPWARAVLELAARYELGEPIAEEVNARAITWPGVRKAETNGAADIRSSARVAE